MLIASEAGVLTIIQGLLLVTADLADLADLAAGWMHVVYVVVYCLSDLQCTSQGVTVSEVFFDIWSDMLKS